MRRYVQSRSDLPQNGCQGAAGSMPAAPRNSGPEIEAGGILTAPSLARGLPHLSASSLLQAA